MSEDTLELPDGRTLGWATYGDPHGTPVVAIHGSPDSRIIWKLADQAAHRNGVRLIAPDRPGFGLSTPSPGRTILDWVDDLDALADHLGIDSYRVMAISGGSPYALATAWKHPDQVEHVCLLSVISPLNAPGVTRDASPAVRLMFFTARRAPILLRPMARVMVRMTLKNTDKTAQRMIKIRPPADREIIRRPDVMAVLLENFPNQFKDADSMATEMRNAARPWGFELADVSVPATIWQGGLDDVHTPAMARHLAENLPNSTLIFEPDYATFNFIDDFDTILARLP